jgi:Zn-dependent protease
MFGIFEIFGMIVTVVAIGYIFKDMFRLPTTEFFYVGEDRRNFILAMLIVSPAVIVHELAHKFVAMSFGFTAVYQASYTWLGIGVLMKMFGFPFLFFVPAYVSIFGFGSSLTYATIAIAGPLVNLLFFLIGYIVTKYELVSGKNYLYFHVFKQINMWLFAFNMLPLPGTDGFQFFARILGF